MTTLKIAQLEDRQAVIELVEDLFLNTAYAKATTLDKAYVEKTFVDSLDNDTSEVCTVLLKEGEKYIGIVAMGKAPMPGNPAQSIATELAFWVLEEYNNYKNKRALLDAFIFWAKRVGCVAAFIGKIKGKNSPETYKVRKL